MRRSVLLVFVFLFLPLSALSLGCGSAGTPADGDRETDTDTVEDGDTAVVCQPGDPCILDEECNACNTATGYHACWEGVCTPCMCEADAECQDGGDRPNWECNDKCQCVPMACDGNSDCPIGYFCNGGECCPSGGHSDVDSVRILTKGGMINEGSEKQFVAKVYNQNGAELYFPASMFEWASTQSDIVTIDAATGLATGGTTSGTATITVTLKGTSYSDTETLINLATPAAGTARVVLTDRSTSELVNGVKVTLNGVDVVTANGMAEFPGAVAPFDLHVLDAGYDYVSAFGLTANDIIVPLTKHLDKSKAGGIKGELDYAPIPERLMEDIRIGLALMAIKGSIIDISNFDALIGDRMKILTAISVSGEYQYAFLPGGLELKLSASEVKKGFYVSAVEGGLNAAWAFGGYAPLDEVVDLFASAVNPDNESIDIGVILPAVMPLFENFYHGILPNLDVEMRDKVVDYGVGRCTGFDGPDINGNGQSDDLVADYCNFQDVGKDLKLSQVQSKKANIQYGKLSRLLGDYPVGVITLAAVDVTGLGIIPLGLNVSLDVRDKDDAADGFVGDASDGRIDLVYAPQHSGINGYPCLIAGIALNIDLDNVELKAGESKPFGISAQLKYFGDASPTSSTFGEFLGMMENGTWDAVSRTFTTTASIGGASFYRVSFIGDNGTWRVYFKPEAGSFTLPVVAGDDPTAEASGMKEAVKLDGTDYNGLFELDSNNLDNLNSLMAGWSAVEFR